MSWHHNCCLNWWRKEYWVVIVCLQCIMNQWCHNQGENVRFDLVSNKAMSWALCIRDVLVIVLWAFSVGSQCQSVNDGRRYGLVPSTTGRRPGVRGALLKVAVRDLWWQAATRGVAYPENLCVWPPCAVRTATQEVLAGREGFSAHHAGSHAPGSGWSRDRMVGSVYNNSLVGTGTGRISRHCVDLVSPVEKLGQHSACWWPGLLHLQVDNSHDITLNIHGSAYFKKMRSSHVTEVYRM